MGLISVVETRSSKQMARSDAEANRMVRVREQITKLPSTPQAAFSPRGFVLGLIFIAGLPSCGGERITLDHALVPAGVPAVISVRAESVLLFGLNRAVANRELEAKVGGKVVGRARTGAGGWASLPVGVLETGVHSIEVAGAGSGQSFRVLARTRGTPILVCDIDGTIYRSGGEISSSEPETDRAQAHAWPGAAEVLCRASKRYGIVYLTAREEAFREETRRFLEAGRFPGGCLVMWNAGVDPVARRSLKTKPLVALRSDWPWLEWGIGDLATDVDAYRAIGLETVRLEPRLDQDRRMRPDGTWLARDWKAILRILEAAGTP